MNIYYRVMAGMLFLMIAISCQKPSDEKIIIFHAGSLAVPMKMLRAEFEKKNPGIEILLEASGSVEAARKITDLKKRCDIVAAADYTVIDRMLIPDHAEYSIVFAGSRMVIAFTEKSRYAHELTKENWHEVLRREGVRYGHSDPDRDPCGYRTMLVWQLAEKFYSKPGLYEALKRGRPEKNIRPKETDLIALAQTGNLDYIFLYESVAAQHKLKYIELPVEIDLGDPSRNPYYSSASIKIGGHKPGEAMEMRGQAVLYGVTILKNPANKKGALAFMNFLLSEEGAAILERSGHTAVHPPRSAQKKNIDPGITVKVNML